MRVDRLYTKNFLRNYDYILTTSCGKILVLDPSCPDLLEHRLHRVDYYLITHAHPDHIAGLENLQKSFGGEVVAEGSLRGKLPVEVGFSVEEGERISFKNESLKVISIPGHIDYHIGFVLEEDKEETAVFLGDTIFNGGVGNTRDGDVFLLYQTFREKILPLGETLTLYPEHDYWEVNLRFTLSLEPENPRAKELLCLYEEGGYRDSGNFPALTMGDEQEYNLFFRTDLPRVKTTIMHRANLSGTPSQEDLFVALRGLRDRWS